MNQGIHYLHACFSFLCSAVAASTCTFFHMMIILTVCFHAENHHAVIAQLRGTVADLELSLISLFSSLVEVTGNGKDVAAVDKETSLELRLPPSAGSSIPFLIKHLSCQLIDSHHQLIRCSITSTQPGVCTVKYTPTLPGPHQLRITIRDTDIPGSPFTVNVYVKGVVKHTITGVKKPHGVAVSKSGEVVVSESFDHCISVYSMQRKRIRSFGSKELGKRQLKYPRSVAINSENHILVADEHHHRIQMSTMDRRFVKSVGQKGHEPLQFQYPSGIAVHPSGRVFVADSSNHRIQVLNPDLTYSHMFGSEGSAPGQFSFPHDVAINSSGVVYVTDLDNHRVQLFSADGQFISSFGSEGSQPGHLCNPSGICIDSRNTVYVTDKNGRVSVYTSSGQFVKCFRRRGSREGELIDPEGVAVDNTTGALYVCDYANDRVVVYY